MGRGSEKGGLGVQVGLGFVVEVGVSVGLGLGDEVNDAVGGGVGVEAEAPGPQE